ncbi:MAG: twin-arginine translocase subunit TatC, partial [Anaerolineales bacterium]|nr:twin-arginine translocase subunit TatC [Anaerolineales bacterium]
MNKSIDVADNTGDEAEENFLEMGLLEHLNELRKRLTWAAGFLIVATLLSFAFAEPVLDFLLIPYANSAA